jgi:BirA family transcriptional regulator, biotin operon repressor / biotin---[acetyl-CoA-carboxylase] ligase
MITINTREVVPRLRTIESLAVIPRVASTNLVGRRIVNECIENELSLPQAMIIAGEQISGRGRNQRHWSSPAGKGIYATTLISLPASELPLVPLAMANMLARFLHEVFGIDARIKWPNDILVGGRKIAGILIEARIHEGQALLLIGTGVNVEPVESEERPNAITIREVSSRDFHDLDTAILSFISFVDEALTQPLDRDAVLSRWQSLTVHTPGDPISCILGDRTISGTWAGIDEHGRALLDTADGIVAVSAGDLVLV